MILKRFFNRTANNLVASSSGMSPWINDSDNPFIYTLRLCGVADPAVGIPMLHVTVTPYCHPHLEEDLAQRRQGAENTVEKQILLLASLRLGARFFSSIEIWVKGMTVTPRMRVSM